MLSPLLFIVFINDILETFKPTTKVSAFADDLALATAHMDKQEALRMMQGEADKVVEWSGRWRPKLNVGKCETYLFTTDTSEEIWRPEVRIDGTTTPRNSNPTFLGVTYDTQLMFTKHMEGNVRRMNQRTGLLSSLDGATWGWPKESMRTVYGAVQRSLVDYASPAWTPWLSISNQQNLESAQLRAARVVTGNLRSTPGREVLQEAGLEELRERTETASMVMYDRWREL